MKDFINGRMIEEVKAAVNTQIFSVNQTDKDQGYIAIDYPRLPNHGLGALVAELKTRCARQPENPSYQAVLTPLEASQRHILCYAALAEEMAGHCQGPQRQQELLTIATISRHSAQHRPMNFLQVCQLFWYLNVTLQYESNINSISLGCFDQYMLPSYQASLNQGQDPAYLKRLPESLWVKCNDIVLLRSSSSARCFAGFPTGYTASPGGPTETGRSVVNALSFLCFDAYQNVQLPQPNLGVRVNGLIDRPFLRKTVETIRLGTGTPQISNDEVVMSVFLNRDVSLEDARDHAVAGCVEPSIPGRIYGPYDVVMFNLLKMMGIMLQGNEHRPNISWNGLICQIRGKIHHYIELIAESSNTRGTGHRDWTPAPLLSPFIEDCVQHGKDTTADGAHCNLSNAQGIGITSLSDSPYALGGTAFNQRRLSFNQLMAMLKANFQTPEGEKICARLINRFDKCGNDIDDADNTSADLSYSCRREVEQYLNPCGGHSTPGSYTISARVPLDSVVSAIPDGRSAGEQLADGGLSPMVGQDSRGPTAVLESVNKLDNHLLSNGTLLNAKFVPAALAGDDGLNKLANSLRAFYKLELQHIQFNMVSADTLREAQQWPWDLAGLMVWVAGYSAFFTELSKEAQDDTIHRATHQL